MHDLAYEPIAAGVLILALAGLGVTRLSSSFLLYGVQTVALGILATWMGFRHHEPLLIAVGSVVAVLKGIGIPLYLEGAARRIECQRDPGTIIAPPLQLFVAVGALALLVLARPFDDELRLGAIPAVGLLLLGMLLMITRRQAISQIVGFLTLENGIFLYATTQPHSMPFIVEIGALMDVLAGAMLAGLLTFKINRSFEHIDVTRLRALRG